MVTKFNYEKKEVDICLSVIVEIMTVLGACPRTVNINV